MDFSSDVFPIEFEQDSCIKLLSSYRNVLAIVRLVASNDLSARKREAHHTLLDAPGYRRLESRFTANSKL